MNKYFPFLNWFSAKNKLNFGFEISDNLDQIKLIENEYNSRMLNFEKALNDTGIYDQYISLRKCALDLVLAEERAMWTKNILNFGRNRK